MVHYTITKRAALSQERKYPSGYVVTYLQGDGKEFDYEFDYIECAVYVFSDNKVRQSWFPIFVPSTRSPAS